MTFGRPEFLYILILVPLFIIFLIVVNKQKQKALAKLGNVTLIEKLTQSVNQRGRQWQTWLWFVVLILLIIALARPQWGSQVEMVEQQGIEIMVILDVSKSMLVEDIKPSRLSRAKLEIVDLMSRLEGNEIGVVLFSGASFIQIPLTSDFATARSFLDGAQPGVISRPGTVIGGAIETALNGFNWQRASQKVIIIMTDGEDSEERNKEAPIAAAETAAERGVIIYTIGFGSPQGNPIPEYNRRGEIIGYKKDKNGAVILSKLDEITLQEIALTANGHYYRASASGNELSALINELDNIQKAELESRFETRHIERFQGFLLVALLAAVIIEFIPDKKRL